MLAVALAVVCTIAVLLSCGVCIGFQWLYEHTKSLVKYYAPKVLGFLVLYSILEYLQWVMFYSDQQTRTHVLDQIQVRLRTAIYDLSAYSDRQSIPPMSVWWERLRTMVS